MHYYTCTDCNIVNTDAVADRKNIVCAECGATLVPLRGAPLDAYLETTTLPAVEPSDEDKAADPEWWRKGPFCPAPGTRVDAPAQEPGMVTTMRALLGRVDGLTPELQEALLAAASEPVDVMTVNEP